MQPAKLTQYQQRVEQHLHLLLARQRQTDPRLLEAMSYSLLLGGKRVRPFLVYSCGTLLGANLHDLDGPAAALEALHSYSLIHDDLPAMDNDDIRRGKPTCHKAFDEATAILAGDALQALAFDILASHPYQQVQAPELVAMLQTFASAAGYAGMCGGQAIDLAQTNQSTSLEQLEQMHRLKTGALIENAVHLAWLCSPNRVPAELKALLGFARALGLAFQVQDDILDIESDTITLGKPQGSDTKANKSTYPALLGLDNAKAKAKQLHQEALNALAGLPYNTDELSAFAHYIIERRF
ncbi:(2E,6E)-farnesyl diphosphate synthase [Rheinheimera maricola]|uniref:(2E,6E)-farnesyl diphosphate synthase n=1 Tax=Rheinheimera maricola TaxID=2793282 RepID=A0ABS7X8X8_9GAMM|nr:(2E,6E)-farnesyl diphosphate synthase [Rheinheimera maricola]MBZ9611994.1 (2E,6E)-farnesyl diphosphate synthase [Rheinheimera maricola]